MLVRHSFARRCLIITLAMLFGSTCIDHAQAKTPDPATYYAIKQLLRQRVRFIVQDERRPDARLPHCDFRRHDCEAILKIPPGGGPYCTDMREAECRARRNGGYILQNCGGQTWLPSTAPKEEREDAATAYYALFLERVMTVAGYPRSVWHPMISDWELSARRDYDTWGNLIMDKLLAEVRIAAERYRRTHPSVPYITQEGRSPAEGGCGAGDRMIKVAAQPSSARIFIIPTFFYDLCQAKGRNPDDTTHCGYWREVLGPVQSISGEYRYRVHWHDGTTRTGTLLPSDSTDAIVIRKP